MSKTVFVDVDDTLIIYQGDSIHPYGVINGEPYEPNYKLIERLKKFDGKIVIWSGGSRDYARAVAKKVLPEELRYIIGSKFEDFCTIKDGDIVVDDQEEYFTAMKKFGVYVFNPSEEWVFKADDLRQEKGVREEADFHRRIREVGIMALKRISKRQAIDYIQEHSNYILEGTSITLGKELLVAQAQLEADLKAHNAVIREMVAAGDEILSLAWRTHKGGAEIGILDTRWRKLKGVSI